MKKEEGNKICFVSVDIEHDVGTPVEKTFRGVEGMDKILDVFRKFEIPATLFITGDVLAKFSERVKNFAHNYEIASHSYQHKYFNELSGEDRREDIKKFQEVYRDLFGVRPKGFRAPSHVVDDHLLRLLEEYGFIYDSSIVPHYPPFKKYRGYSGKAPLAPYKVGKLIELPVSGQLLGIPVAGAWIRKLPVFVYRILFVISKPQFITLSMHSWDILDARFIPKLVQILEILKKNKYAFKSGEQIAMAESAR